MINKLFDHKIFLKNRLFKKSVIKKKKYYGQNNSFIVKSILYLLLYCTCPEIYTENFLNVLLQNLMSMGHFEIYISSYFKKIISRKLIHSLS